MSTNKHSKGGLAGTNAQPTHQSPQTSGECFRPLASCSEASTPAPDGRPRETNVVENSHDNGAQQNSRSSSVVEPPLDSGYSSLGEEEEPDIILNEIEVENTGCAAIGWFVGDPLPSFSTLGPEDIQNLCHLFKIKPETGQVQLNFRRRSPLWALRCEFTTFYCGYLRELTRSA